MKRITLSVLFVLAAFVVSGIAAESAVQTPSLNTDDQILITLLSSDNLNKRVKAAQELADRGVNQAAQSLVNMMQNDVSAQGRIVAAKALLDMKSMDSLDAMKNQASIDDNKTVRTALKGMVKQLEQTL
jgi:HEAT repeat protein